MSTDLAIIDTDAAQQALLTGERIEGEQDPDEARRQIILRLLTAEDDSQLNSSNAAHGAADVLDIPHELHAVRWLKSAFEDGNTVFAVADAVNLDTGERYAVTTSSDNIMAALINLDRRKRFPARVIFKRTEKQTARGFRPMYVEILGVNGGGPGDN